MKTATFKIIGLASALVLGGKVIAQDYLLLDTQRALNSPQIDVDGRFNSPQESRRDDRRRQLERQNEEMVSERIEDIRMRQEKELARGLQEAFSRGLRDDTDLRDQVRHQEAAVEKEPEVRIIEVHVPKPDPAPVVVEEPTRYDNKVNARFGVTNTRGDLTDFESKVDLNVGFETHLNRYISFGVEMGYMSMSIKDVNPNNQNFNQMNNYYNNYYYDYYGYNQHFYGFYQDFGRDIDYKEVNFKGVAKIHILPEARVRPYIGVGIGYKRSGLSYSNGPSNVGTFQQSFTGDEKYTANYVTGHAHLGTDIALNEVISARLDFGYAKGITTPDRGIDFTQTMGETFLRNIGRNLADSDFFSLGAGIVIGF